MFFLVRWNHHNRRVLVSMNNLQEATHQNSHATDFTKIWRKKNKMVTSDIFIFVVERMTKIIVSEKILFFFMAYIIAHLPLALQVVHLEQPVQPFGCGALGDVAEAAEDLL